MIELTCGSSSAMIVLHEIYGINQHIRGVCEQYRACGYDVYCPNLLGRSEPFRYDEQEPAYQHYRDHVAETAQTQIHEFLRDVQPCYKSVHIVGFSVGATLAWMLTGSGCCGRAVCYYGSRIRDHLGVQPKCPTLLVFAEQEASFCPVYLLNELQSRPYVTAVILDGRHGFMDPFSANYNPVSADEAHRLTQRFLAS